MGSLYLLFNPLSCVTYRLTWPNAALSHWLLNLLLNQAKPANSRVALGLTEDSTTTDFFLGLLVFILIRRTIPDNNEHIQLIGLKKSLVNTVFIAGKS